MPQKRIIIRSQQEKLETNVKQESVLTLPLTPEQCLDGVTRVIESRLTTLGRELSDCLTKHHEKKNARQKAQLVLNEKRQVFRTQDGAFTAVLMAGYPISTEQAIEQQIYSETYPDVDFDFLTTVRTFSFACHELDEVLAFFSASKSLGVCLTPTKMYLSSIDYYKPSAFGQYLVEIVTTSRMSMIFRAMRDAKTDARATLRQCPLAENKLYPNDTIEEQIEEVEQLEIQRRIACAKQM